MIKNREAEIKKALAYEAKRKEERPVTSDFQKRLENLKIAGHKFFRNKLSGVGLAVVVLIILAAAFAPYITPYPAHAGAYVDFAHSNNPPSAQFLLGTDNMGRDILTRIIFSFRGALYMTVVVLAISVPVGVFLGILGGYLKGTLVDTIIMRITDVFLSVPALLLALAVASVLKPNLTNAMIAVTLMWWPWYTRLVYGMATSCRNENFVISAELMGASKAHIIFKEILPNCLSAVFTKMALDVGWVILIGATLSYVGLGEQPPTPSLGQMVSDGARYMPDSWWMTIFPSIAIIIIILGFNFMGDGIGDMLSKGDGKDA
ncbi:ABC-type dipeptide/oligopeptide/nickel transport system, permease component [Desulfosporosinus orientis DSM 765]|uniref:ABC-type dipeptide/oligopeptide/nickel transport system, permease component n=1 Tax=Desulfosporosinus orientis (strain ATCC 19365 / DSM 765 / NCIMB 8382 / VKM B-1628 / Singapore I) TaxID=768706 RepID=G7WGM6_DESOD|nr:ABC transporter permease [Desulfosporosinus orientis]AET68462.1 ABC-type dipeptide/oligopeptide/nickel transport system, permease component [Desulfosporosinus orientis DSM 765]